MTAQTKEELRSENDKSFSDINNELMHKAELCSDPNAGSLILALSSLVAVLKSENSELKLRVLTLENAILKRIY